MNFNFEEQEKLRFFGNSILEVLTGPLHPYTLLGFCKFVANMPSFEKMVWSVHHEQMSLLFSLFAVYTLS